MAAQEKKHILIIEDEQNLALGLGTLLKSQDYQVSLAYDAMFGISLAHKENPDLIILDLGLPAGGGFFVLENLKKSINTNKIPVLILTAKTDKESQDKSYKMGAAIFFKKPFNPQELLAAITNLLTKK